MKIETQPRDDHQITLKVEVDSQQMESAKRRAARRLSERAKIPGFRPGKAPYDVVLRFIGEGRITEEAADLLLDEVYPEALKEAKVDPSGPGALEKVESLDPPKFVLTVPLMPSVDLGNYRAIRQVYDWHEPGAEKIDEAIEELRRMYSKTESINRPIQQGDFVMIDLKGIKENAAQSEAPVIDRPGYPVFIRTEAKDDEWPFAGFSEELIGLNIGESKSFRYKYPKDYKDESLQGLNVNFEVNIKMVRGAILPELNDEFAKMVGPFENLNALREAVHANLVTQSKAEYDDDYFVQLIDKIKEGATVKYPPQMLDHEIEHVMDDLKSRLAEQGLDMESYLKTRQMDLEKFTAEEARPVAVRRLERSLIMDEVTRAEKVEVNQETLNTTFQQTWGEFRSSDEFRKVMRGKNTPPKRLMDAVAMESASRAITRQTLARLKEIATGQVGTTSAAKKSGKTAASRKASAAKSGGNVKKSPPKPAARKTSIKEKATVKSTKKTTAKKQS